MPKHRRTAAVTGQDESLLVPIGGEAAVVAVVQLAPIALLAVESYAVFAAVYLAFGLLYGALLAVLGDVWARSRGRPGHAESPEGADDVAYYTVLTELAVAGGAMVGAVAVALLPVTQGVLAGVGCALALYRAGSRYYQLNTGRARRAGLADLVAALLGAIAVLMFYGQDALSATAALGVWVVTCGASLLVSGQFRYRPAFGLGPWLRTHAVTVRMLLVESVVMNVASAGTPYVVGAVAGLPALAAVRAATSLLYPVRLILGAARSRIVAGRYAVSARLVAGVSILGTLLGLAVAAGLLLVKRSGLPSGSTLHLLAEAPAPLAVLVLGNLLSTFLQLHARGALPGGALLTRRVVHSAVMLALTAVGASVGGVIGALWGCAIATAVTVLVWAAPHQGAVSRNAGRAKNGVT